LFTSIGLVFDPNKDYTIQDLIDLKLDDYIDLINLIFKGANTESSQSHQLNQIIDLWSNKLQFKLAKNFPMKLFNDSYFNLTQASSSLISPNISTTSKIKVLRQLSMEQIKEQDNLMKNVNYKLVDINEIRYTAEDSSIKLNLIIQSKITKKTRDDALEFRNKISEILNLTELWFALQHKWLFLDRIFSEQELHRMTSSLRTFFKVSEEFKVF
jgi:hypothetical protein